jgi:hypothetical protein
LRSFLERDWAPFPKRRRIPDPAHTQYYRDYFTFDALLAKLRLNRKLGAKTAARMRVHYNFLSGFVHQTHESTERLLNIHWMRHDNYVIGYNHYHSELALLYVAHISKLFLDWFVNYFKRWKFRIAGEQEYIELSKRVERQFGYFWFVYNSPHDYDRYVDANRLSDWNKRRFVRPSEVTDRQVRYHDDPLRRLRELHGSQHELTTGNVYQSPFHRDDAVFGRP